MDKILSARVDEVVLSKLNSIAAQLHKSKKSVLESAIQLYASQIEKTENRDIFDDAFGAWDRTESTVESLTTARTTFNQSMQRHHK